MLHLIPFSPSSKLVEFIDFFLRTGKTFALNLIVSFRLRPICIPNRTEHGRINWHERMGPRLCVGDQWYSTAHVDSDNTVRERWSNKSIESTGDFLASSARRVRERENELNQSLIFFAPAMLSESNHCHFYRMDQGQYNDRTNCSLSQCHRRPYTWPVLFNHLKRRMSSIKSIIYYTSKVPVQQ